MYIYIHMIHMCVKSSPTYAIFESGISQRFLKLRLESCNSVRYFSWKKSGSYQLILLMVQKSCDHQLRLAVYPIIYTVLAPSQVVSRISEPSTVWKISQFFVWVCHPRFIRQISEPSTISLTMNYRFPSKIFKKTSSSRYVSDLGAVKTQCILSW